MNDWRKTTRIALTSAAITSVVWLGIGAVMLQNYRLVPPDSPLLIETSRTETIAARPGPSGLVIPVAGVRAGQLADTFTQAREGGLRVHDAIDIMAARGTPVLAASEGRIEKLFVSRAGGNTIYQRSPEGELIFYYAHLDSYAPGLAEGLAVRAGQRIGTVGSTGNANPAAPHLHFAVLRTRPAAKWHEPATPLNPYPLLGGK